MNIAPLASALFFLAAPAIAQSSPKDDDKRSVQGYFYELTPLKPGPDFAASLKLPRGYRATVSAGGLGNTRLMAVVPDGFVYVSRRSEADIVRLVDANQDGRADGPLTVIVTYAEPK